MLTEVKLLQCGKFRNFLQFQANSKDNIDFDSIRKLSFPFLDLMLRYQQFILTVAEKSQTVAIKMCECVFSSCQ